MKALSKFLRAECREELIYAGDLALVSELLEGLKAKLETSKGALESTGLRLNVKKKKITVIVTKLERLEKKRSLFCGVCRISVSSNPFLYQFFKCAQHRRCIGIRGKLKQDDEFKFSVF